MSHLKTPIWVHPSDTTSYPVLVGQNCLNTVASQLKSQLASAGKPLGRCAILTNPEVATHYIETVQKALLEEGFNNTLTLSIPSGEDHKSISEVTRVWHELLEQRLERGDTLIALGGGIIGDMTGFVASCYLRGIRFVQVPTSLLAQVDAAIGGKTGVNTAQGKNLVGTFYQPDFVLCDIDCLKTLPERELTCGLAEIIKYGVIMDPALFETLETHQDILRSRQLDGQETVWMDLVTQSAQNKAQIVSEDETEQGRREILNYGHTLGHAIEAHYGYGTYKHGEAIAIGMVAANDIAVQLGLLSQADSDRIHQLILNLGFATDLKPTNPEDLAQRLQTDKKVRAGNCRFVLPTHIGHVETGQIPSSDCILEMIKKRMGQ